MLNKLNTRVILKIEKDKIRDVVGWMKKVEGVNWLVSQPSLYDVFTNVVN